MSYQIISQKVEHYKVKGLYRLRVTSQNPFLNMLIPSYIHVSHKIMSHLLYFNTSFKYITGVDITLI